MRKPIFAALLALALLSAGGQLYAGTFHVIIFANTEDEGIGCIHDVVNVGAFVRDAQKETGMVTKVKVFMTVSQVAKEKLDTIKKWAIVTDGWSKALLEKEFKALTPAADDIVMFYYSGHGGRMSSKKGRWPDMALQDHDLVDLAYPVDVLSKKPVQPRFILVMGDCCNSFMDRSVAPQTKAAKSTEGLRNLFLNFSGAVVASGSEPGQYSLGGSDGGVFTNSYFKAAYNPTNSDWDAVLGSAQALAARSTGGQQKPQFELKGVKPVEGGVAVASAAPTSPTTPAPASAPAPASSGWGSAQSSSSSPQTAAPTQSASSGWGSAQSSSSGSQASAQASDEDDDEADDGGGLFGFIDAALTAIDDALSESDSQFSGEDSFALAIPIVKGKASGTRKPGNSRYPFTELVAASLEDDDGDLEIVFELKSLPAKLTFNSKDVPDDYLEYEWAATLDIDGDGAEDFILSLMHFKPPKSKAYEARIVDACQANLWFVSEESFEAVDVEVDARIEKNKLVLTVPDYGDYFEFERGSAVTFSSVYYVGGESYIP